MPRRRAALTLAASALALASLTSAVAPVAQAAPAVEVVAARAPGGPTVTPTKPLAGETTTFAGRLGSRVARPVTLQRKKGSAWITLVKGRSRTDGSYRLASRLPKTGQVRVVAPTYGRRKALVGQARTVFVAADTASVALTGDTSVATATVTYAPVRVGRTLTLESRIGSTWSAVGQAQQETATGTAHWSLPELSSGSRQYRVRVGVWQGAGELASSAVSFAPAITWAIPDRVHDLVLTTTGGAAIDSRDTYVNGTAAADGGAARALQVRGHGRAAWGWDKKPYEIRLGTAAPLLGLPSDQDFVLLANRGDASLVRNWLALALGRRTDLAWTPQARYVHLKLNGKDLGSYLLVEAVEQAPAKVAPGAGGLLLEVDENYEGYGRTGYRTDHGTPLAFVDPTVNDVKKTELVTDVEAFEDVLYGPGFANPTTGYAKYVDVGSVVDYYLVEELFKVLDSDFQKDVYVTWAPGKKFALGPVGDVELGSGFVYWEGEGYFDKAQGWWLRGGTVSGFEPSDHPHHTDHWIARMFADPAFVAKVEARWAQLRPVVDELLGQLPQIQGLLTTSATADRAIWEDGVDWYSPWYGMDHATEASPGFPGEIDFLETWLAVRAAWMTGQLD